MTTPDTQELIKALEPCPFCRGEFPPVLTVEGSINRPTVICAGCSALGPSRATEAEAIAAWNTRARSADEQGGAGMELCPDCNGAGGDNNTYTCERCNGAGGVSTPPDDLVETVARALTERKLYRVKFPELIIEPASDSDAKAVLQALSPHLSEREKIVAWLLRHYDGELSANFHTQQTAKLFVDAISRGDHISGESQND